MNTLNNVFCELVLQFIPSICLSAFDIQDQRGVYRDLFLSMYPSLWLTYDLALFYLSLKCLHVRREP